MHRFCETRIIHPSFNTQLSKIIRTMRAVTNSYIYIYDCREYRHAATTVVSARRSRRPGTNEHVSSSPGTIHVRGRRLARARINTLRARAGSARPAARRLTRASPPLHNCSEPMTALYRWRSPPAPNESAALSPQSAPYSPREDKVWKSITRLSECRSIHCWPLHRPSRTAREARLPWLMCTELTPFLLPVTS